MVGTCGVPHQGPLQVSHLFQKLQASWPSDLDELSRQDPSDVQVLGVGLKGLVVPRFPSATGSHWGWGTQSTPRKAFEVSRAAKSAKVDILMWLNAVSSHLFFSYCRVGFHGHATIQ